MSKNIASILKRLKLQHFNLRSIEANFYPHKEIYKRGNPTFLKEIICSFIDFQVKMLALRLP